MNVETSVRRLPPSIRRLIEAETTIQSRLIEGESLERILASAEWAGAWAEAAEQTVLESLKAILVRFAGLAFEAETAVNAVKQQSKLTGAEVRVALARMRRSGVVFAVRKAWGDRLYYVPTDMAPVWQALLLPIQGKPLDQSESAQVNVKAKPFRLPLCLELLTAWFSVYREPLTFTAKGLLQRPPVARMTGQMRLTSEELAFLSLTYPQHEHIPAQSALAIDLGMSCGVLRKDAGTICICDSGLKAWLRLTPAEADARLHRLVLERFSSVDPGLHLTASAIQSLPAHEWFCEEQLLQICGERKKADDWLTLMEGFGWVERGTWRQLPVFRKTSDFSSPSGANDGAPGLFYVQPDGEIIVTPDVGLGNRWTLEQVAERVAADTLFVYRLTRSSCGKAADAGFTLTSITEFLERGSGEPLPEPVAAALTDWFARLGKVKFVEVTLLRTESAEVAERLLQNPDTSALLLEKVGDKDFIVEASSVKPLTSCLLKMGYPPCEPNAFMPASEGAMQNESADFNPEEQGWVHRHHLISIYEPDQTFPRADDLFPGVSDIPAAWIRQPRSYHLSTRKELIQRAISWQTSLQIRRDGSSQTFVPKALEEEGPECHVLGQWRNETDAELHPVESVRVKPAQFDEMMILLPAVDEFQPD